MLLRDYILAVFKHINEGVYEANKNGIKVDVPAYVHFTLTIREEDNDIEVFKKIFATVDNFNDQNNVVSFDVPFRLDIPLPPTFSRDDIAVFTTTGVWPGARKIGDTDADPQAIPGA